MHRKREHKGNYSEFVLGIYCVQRMGHGEAILKREVDTSCGQVSYNRVVR